MRSKILLLILVCLACVARIEAQDWTRSISNKGIARQILSLPNGDAMLLTDTTLMRISSFGEVLWDKKYAANVVRFTQGIGDGFVLIGAQSSSKSGTRVIRIDDNGGVVWTKDLPQGSSWSNEYALCTSGLSGYVFSNQYQQKQHITMLSANGNVVWDRLFDFVNVVVDKSIITDNNGDILAAGVRGVLKLSAQGDSLWYSKFTAAGKPFSIVQNIENQYIVVGSTVNSSPDFVGGKLFVAKLNTNGQLQWSSVIGAVAGAGLNDAVATSDGGFTAVGRHDLGGFGLFYFDKNGLLEWKKFPIQNTANLSSGLSIAHSNDGKYLLAGTQWKVIANQNIYNATFGKVSDINDENFIVGRVFFDKNTDCKYDNSDQNLSEWIVKLSDGTKQYFATSDKNGNFSANVPKGNYTISTVLPNEFYKPCTPIATANVLKNDTIALDFAMQTQPILCPQLRVNMTAAKLAICSDAEYSVQYSNDGTQAATNAYIIVNFDKAMTYKSSTIVGQKLSNTGYRFELNTVDIGQKGYFKIKTAIRCDSVQAQQAISAVATIFPNISCAPSPANWSGARLDVAARCDADSVRFEVKNKGVAPMQSTIDIVIEEDILMLQTQPIKLNTAEILKFNLPRNGSTYRITLPQEANFPYPSHPTAFVEGCGTNTNGGFSKGFVTMFPEDEAMKFKDIDCQELDKTYGASHKESFPKGINTAHFVAKNTEIEYLIRFQNTFSDSTKTLVIYDTLSALLNPSTLEMGASSHNYTWELLGNGVLKCTFPNINLSPNGAAANGFLQFRIAQKNNNPIGARIYNTVRIYQNNHAPQTTNETFLTVGENYFQILPNAEVTDNQYVVNIFPNPFASEVFFEILNPTPDDYTFTVMDNKGQVVFAQQYSSNTWTLPRGALAQGLHLYSIRNKQGKLVQSGKLMALGN